MYFMKLVFRRHFNNKVVHTIIKNRQSVFTPSVKFDRMLLAIQAKLFRRQFPDPYSTVWRLNKCELIWNELCVKFPKIYPAFKFPSYFLRWLVEVVISFLLYFRWAYPDTPFHIYWHVERIYSQHINNPFFSAEFWFI